MFLDASYDGKRHDGSRKVISIVSCARQYFISGILYVCVEVQNWSEVLNFNFGCMDSPVQALTFPVRGFVLIFMFFLCSSVVGRCHQQ